MFPRLWSHQIKIFCKIFILSLSGFIAILLLTRLKEMARFLSLSSSVSLTCKFCLLQIPLISPLAVPISCLLASFIVFYRKQEIIAQRASGLSLAKILFPTLGLSFLIFLGNFYLVSEVAPLCKAKTKHMIQAKTTLNPILLLQRKNFSRLNKSFIDLNPQNTKEATQVVCLVPSYSQRHLCLFLAESLILKQHSLVGKNVSLLTYISPKEKNPNFEPLIVENLGSFQMEADILGQMMKKQSSSRRPSSFQLSYLCSSLRENFSKNFSSFALEIIRRLVIAFSAISFSLLGASFGIQIGRHISYKNILVATCIALTILSSFTLGKALGKSTLFAILLYLVPQIFLIVTCRLFLVRINQGIE